MQQRNAHRRRGFTTIELLAVRGGERAAFTTIELLVVIGIIVMLVGLLIPVVGKIRDTPATDTAAWVQNLGAAIEAYHSDFRPYPGPLPNEAIRAANAGDIKLGFVNPWPSEYAMQTGLTTDGNQRVTMAENVLLGLIGGLRPDPANPGTALYDPTLVGNGPMSLNPGQPKRYNAYIEPKNLSWMDVAGKKTGAFIDEVSGTTGADDSIIPEFVDRFSDPLPILILRAKVGHANGIGNPMNNGKFTNPVITDNRNDRLGQYDISQIMGYTNPKPAIGVGRRLPVYYENNSVQNAPDYVHGLTGGATPLAVNGAQTLKPGPGYTYPYNAFPYFRDPSLSNPQVEGGSEYKGPHVARQKDRFILISAGTDRIYGTTDDITNFGPVIP